MNSPRLVLPIDPQRSTWWALVEFCYCLLRDILHLIQAGGRRWRRARRSLAFRILRALIVGGILTLGGAAADQQLHILHVVRPLLAALTA